jgi:hypothetical protein
MMLLGMRRRLLLVFHSLQLGSHVGLLLLQQRLALFRFPCFLLFLRTVEGQTGTARNQAADDDVFLQATQTVVVSWNDAAEMNESVDSDALVIPSSTFSYVAGSFDSAFMRSFSSSNSERSTCSPTM